MTNKLWFKAKRFGWGWTPTTWQGWTITIAYLVIILSLGFKIDEDSNLLMVSLRFLLPTILLTGILIGICYKKGEKPRWRWG